MMVFHFHPFASFCQKALIGLYELDVPHEKNLVDLGNEESRAKFYALWPFGKFPLLVDGERKVGESSIVLEYVDSEHRLIPEAEADALAALDCRFWDRFFDSYVQTPMQKVVADYLRQPADRDPLGVQEAKAQLASSYKIANDLLLADNNEAEWALGSDFTLVDCAAAPALFFAKIIVPFSGNARLAGYYERLTKRPSIARVFEEAAPYMKIFPIPESEWS